MQHWNWSNYIILGKETKTRILKAAIIRQEYFETFPVSIRILEFFPLNPLEKEKRNLHHIVIKKTSWESTGSGTKVKYKPVLSVNPSQGV